METISTDFKYFCHNWLKQEKIDNSNLADTDNADTALGKSHVIDNELQVSKEYLEKEAETRIGHNNPNQHVLADEMAGIIVSCLDDYKSWLEDNL